MADLDRAAEAAVAKLKEIAEMADAAEAALEDLLAHLTARRDQLAKDAEELATERRERYERLLEDEAERLDISVAETEAGLTDAQAAIGGAHQEARQELLEARAALAALAAPLAARTDEIDEAVDAFNAAARSLSEEALTIQSQVEKAFDDTGAFLDQVTEKLRTLREAVTARVAALREAMAAEYDRAIKDQQLHWLVTLRTVAIQVERAFKDAEQHAETITAFAQYQAARRHEAAMGTLTPRVAEASDLIAPLIAQLENETEALTDAAEGVAQAAGGTEQAADSLARDLERLADALARHTFIKDKP